MTRHLLCIVVAGFCLLSRDASAQRTPPCAQSLWGCGARSGDGEVASGGSTAQRYERLMNLARSSAGALRTSTTPELDAAARHLHDAIDIEPDSPDAYSLLGQVEIERGQIEAAGAALRHAEGLLLGNGAIERSDPQLALALGLVTALEGNLSGALERYMRLLRVGAPSHRLLYRTGDVLMALGRLDEATALYERACNMQRGYDTPLLDVPRACQGALVALDRGERVRAAQALRRVHQLDHEGKVMRYSDYLAPWEREYHLAMALPPSCDRLAALRNYLRGAKSTTANSPVAPLSYIRRAETHVKALAALPCPPG